MLPWHQDPFLIEMEVLPNPGCKLTLCSTKHTLLIFLSHIRDNTGFTLVKHSDSNKSRNKQISGQSDFTRDRTHKVYRVKACTENTDLSETGQTDFTESGHANFIYVQKCNYLALTYWFYLSYYTLFYHNIGMPLILPRLTNFYPRPDT